MKANLFHRLWNHSIYGRLFLIGQGMTTAVLACILFLGYYLGQDIPSVEAFIRGLGIWGPFIFILLVLILTPLFVPITGFALIAGALFGLWWGSVIIIFAGIASELIIFTAGHKFLRERVEKILARHTRLLAVKNALVKKPIRLMILIRLTPLPYTPICYMLSTTRISYRDYIIGYLGHVPGNIIAVYFGIVAKEVAQVAGGTESISTEKFIWTIITLLALIILVVYVSHVSKRAIEEDVALNP